MSGAQRQRLLRQRRASGRVVLSVEVDEESLAYVLAQSGRLASGQQCDRDTLRAALQAAIDEWAASSDEAA